MKGDFYSRSIKDVFKELKTDEKGLSEKEASTRLKKYGPNKLENKYKISKWKIFLSQFQSFIVLILIAATILSYAIGETIDALVILIIVVFNAFFGFIQEFKAEKSIEALKKLSALKSVVIRNGKQFEIDSADLVPGDILILEDGTKIPADCRIFEFYGLEVQESSLTGESVPVSKSSKVLKGKLALGDQKNMAFSSTIVVRGKGKAVVVNTGNNSEVGKIAKMIQNVEREKTPLQNNLDKLGKRLGIATIIICICIFGLEFFNSFDKMPLINAFNESFMIAVALAVAAIPEGLPAVVTISLALGVRNMVKKHALIRKMSSVETLGCTNIICSDKTGTLTKNEMTVRKLFCNNQIIEVTGDGYLPEGDFLIKGKKFNAKKLQQLLKIGVLCNDSKLISEDDKWRVIGDPTEGCLLVSAMKSGIDLERTNLEYSKVDEIPFSSENKYMISVNKKGKDKNAYVKGAPEILLNMCSKIEINGKVSKLTSSMKRKILKTNEQFTNSALRVLGFAYKPVKNKDYDSNLIFVGLQGMMDPPRSKVKDNIAECKKAGIRVVMITGDNENTALAIAGNLGIKGNALTGSELDKLSDDEFNKIVSKVSVYARVNPEHKIKIVKALKKKGNVVAMTGDGVNDAPALKNADIGVAMGITGTDVAKEASDMILTDDNFNSIVSAVENGRGIYDNIKKFINYLLTSNFAEILVILVATLLGWPLPLTAIHLLWLNLITDGLPAIALGVDPPQKKIMELMPRNPKKNIIDKGMIWAIIFVGTFITIATLTLFKLNSADLMKAQTIAFTSLVVFEIVRLQAIRVRFNQSMFSNKYLLLAILSSLGLQLMVIYTPLNTFFKTVPLLLIDWIHIGGMTIGMIIVFYIFGTILKHYNIED